MTNLTYYFMVLDIETSTEFKEITENNIVKKVPLISWLSYGYCKFYNMKGETLSKCAFRKWEELDEYLRKISNYFYKYKCTCYVHNLAYEFDFLIKNISRPLKMLANNSHAVISCTLEKYKNIEFKCTYQLSGYALRKIGERINLPKLESEYRTIYPNDEITQEEWYYCERDCDIVAVDIAKTYLREYGKISEIPLTKTGRVRKTFNAFYKEEYKDKECEWDLMPPENCYQAMLDSFSGGITISNPWYTAIPLKNVHSYDIKSSYPYAILKEQFPYTIRKEENPKKSMLKKYKFWIAKIKFKNISSKYSWSWLSKDKMNDFDAFGEFFNGKVISADYIIRTVTNVDYEMILLTYNFSSIEIEEFYPLEKYSKIPKPYIDTIKIYGEIKDNKGKEVSRLEEEGKEGTQEYLEVYADYMLAKNDYNSIYGMAVQKLVQEEYIIDENFNWHKKDLEYKYIEGKHLKRNFLFGIFITAYARRNLLRGILKNCPLLFVYSDTDSIKFIGENVFVDTNERLDGEFKEISYLKNLGKFEYEKTYEEFKTFGAKKYCWKYNNIYGVTVAGLPKVSGQINSLDDFYCGREFKNCKLAKKYIYNSNVTITDFDDEFISSHCDNEIEEFITKNNVDTKGGVSLFPVSYVLDMTHNDKSYIKMIESLRDLNEKK